MKRCSGGSYAVAFFLERGLLPFVTGDFPAESFSGKPASAWERITKPAGSAHSVVCWMVTAP